MIESKQSQPQPLTCKKLSRREYNSRKSENAAVKTLRNMRNDPNVIESGGKRNKRTRKNRRSSKSTRRM
jgi:hypothetical protein